MATIILNLDQPAPVTGVGNTYQYTTKVSGPFNIQYQVLVVPPSGLSLVINQNGSPVHTATITDPVQVQIRKKVLLNCAQGDVLQIVLSSSTASDEQLNTVKSILMVGEGN